MNWLLLSIGTTVLWGISVVLIKKSYFSLSPVMGILTGAAAAVAILLPFAAFNQTRFVFWPLTPVAFVVVLSYMFFYYALQKDKVTLTAIMQSTYPLWTVLFASLFLDEQTSLAAKSGVLVIVAGVILLSIERPEDFKRVKAGPWFWWGGTAALLAGFGDFLAKAMILEYDSYSFLLSFVAAWVTAALLIAFLDRKNITAPAFDRNSLYLVVSQCILFVGYIFFFLAYETGLASVVTPITGAYSTVAMILGIVWLKEKISAFQLAGAVIAIAGIVLVSAG